jgi:hypothetical protein
MHTDRLEILLAFEASFALAAPVLAPMAFVVHMSLGCPEGVECGVATLAVEVRTPVAVLIHVLDGPILSPVQVIA